MLRSARQPKRWLNRRSTLVVCLGLFVMTTLSFVGEYWRNRDMRREIQRLEGVVERMEQKNFELARLGQRFGSDAVFEREARINLGLQKPGESVIIFRDEAATATAETVGGSMAETEVPDAPGPLSNVRKWWRYFFPPTGDS